MKTPKSLTRFVAALMVMVTFVTAAGSAMATDIANITTEVTTLFIDLIPLIIILGVFGMIMGVIKLRR